jgi:putative sterol carrier protein
MGDDLKKMADDIMKTMTKKLNEGKDRNKDWGKTINIVFSDIEVGYSLKYAMDGSVECKKETAEDAEATVNSSVDDMKKTLDGEINSGDAYRNGLWQVEGDVMSLWKLAPAFGN